MLTPTLPPGTGSCLHLLICLFFFLSSHSSEQHLGFYPFHLFLHFIINFAAQGWAVVSFRLGCYTYVDLLKKNRLLVLQPQYLEKSECIKAQLTPGVERGKPVWLARVVRVIVTTYCPCQAD